MAKYEELPVDESIVVLKPVNGGVFAFLRIRDVGWGVLLRCDVEKYAACPRLSGVPVRVFSYESLLHLLLRHADRRTAHHETCARQFNALVAVVEERVEEQPVQAGMRAVEGTKL